MILSDFVSRQRTDNSNPHEIIPISFDMKAILKDKYYNVGDKAKYMVQTCTQTKDRGIKLPETHGINKGVDPDLKPEWIVRKAQKLMEQSRLEPDRESPSGDTPIQEQKADIGKSNIREQLVQKQIDGVNIPQVSQNSNRSLECDKGTIPKLSDRLQIKEPQVPFYPDPIVKPPPRPPDTKIQHEGQINLDLDIEINKDFEENSSYQA